MPREQLVKAVPHPPTTWSLGSTGQLSWDQEDDLGPGQCFGKIAFQEEQSMGAVYCPLPTADIFHFITPCLNLYTFNLGLKNDGWNTEACCPGERLQFRGQLEWYLFSFCSTPSKSPPPPPHTLCYSMPLTTKKTRFPHPRLIFCF